MNLILLLILIKLWIKRAKNGTTWKVLFGTYFSKTRFLTSKSADMTWPSWLTFTTNVSFEMRYCLTLYLKGHQSYSRSKFKLTNLLNENRSFNFDLPYFWYPLRYRIMQYLISKLTLVVNMSQEGQGMAKLLSCVKLSSKSQFYYTLFIWKWKNPKIYPPLTLNVF